MSVKPKNVEGTLIKKAHAAQKWTEQDIEHLLKCQDLVTGPEYFLENFFFIQHPTKGRIQYNAFEYQKKLLDSYHNHRFSVNMLGRQLGKCLYKNINTCIMNKRTGITYDMPIGKLYEYEFAKKYNQPLPDISQFARKNM